MSKTEDLGIISKSILSDTANAIREKTGSNELLSPQEFASEIANISGGKPEEVANVTPTTSVQTINPDTGKVFNQVNVSAVTSSIDANIQAENIKKDVSILGVTGTLEGEGGLQYEIYTPTFKSTRYMTFTTQSVTRSVYLVSEPNPIKIKGAYRIYIKGDKIGTKEVLSNGTYEGKRYTDYPEISCIFRILDDTLYIDKFTTYSNFGYYDKDSTYIIELDLTKNKVTFLNSSEVGILITDSDVTTTSSTTVNGNTYTAALNPYLSFPPGFVNGYIGSLTYPPHTFYVLKLGLSNFGSTT